MLTSQEILVESEIQVSKALRIAASILIEPNSNPQTKMSVVAIKTSLKSIAKSFYNSYCFNLTFKVIQAEGERKASRALREASQMLNDKPVALQLRYLQTLSGIAAEHHSTIIFPLPIDMTTSFLMSGPNNPLNNPALRNIPNGVQNFTNAAGVSSVATNGQGFRGLSSDNNINNDSNNTTGSSELNV